MGSAITQAGEGWPCLCALLCTVTVPLGTSWSDPQQTCFLHFGSKQVVPAAEEVQLPQQAKADPTHPRTSALILALGPTQRQGAGTGGRRCPQCVTARA